MGIRKIAGRLIRHVDVDYRVRKAREIADRFEYERLLKFLRETDFEKLDVSGFSVRRIVSGNWAFLQFNTHFCREMLANATYCLSYGHLPTIALISGDKDQVNLWEMFFEQPYPDAAGRDQVQGYMTCDRACAPLYFPEFPKQEDVRLFSKLFRPPMLVFNARTREYIEAEYEEILRKRAPARVCGVLCRGTDYIGTKGLAVQPSADEMIEFVREKMEKLHCEYIYLATEEYKVEQKFENAFPGRVLVNKRRYYDAYWELEKKMGKDARVALVHGDRENDAYLSALEYLSSLVLLSRCDALIAGACGGSYTALYMNGGKYDYWHLFNKGRYQ